MYISSLSKGLGSFGGYITSQRNVVDLCINKSKSFIYTSALPSFLVENKSMYSILSLGIHELNEQTCLEHFDTLRVGIEIILDEKLDELKKKEKIENAKKKLANLKGEVKK